MGLNILQASQLGLLSTDTVNLFLFKGLIIIDPTKCNCLLLGGLMYFQLAIARRDLSRGRYEISAMERKYYYYYYYYHYYCYYYDFTQTFS